MHRLGLAFLLTCVSALAGEYAVLATGARLHVDRHQAEGSRVLLYNAGGSIEMDSAQITRFESDGLRPPSAVPAATPSPAAHAAVSPGQLADAAADKYQLPRRLVRSVMAAESGFQPQAVSSKGAIGLMQLMPATAQELGADPHDPAQNVDAGTRYLRALLERYHGWLYPALAAYNAGTGAVEKYNGVPPYPETVHYVKRITRDFQKAN
ncbi:MAG TPA: lytic transglycosylase domain-containing protein [Bryobacteraceae bacterium]|nr:lytic transglycosylase domain-containing protein [Bryobacteraceae bacterium]